MLLALPSTCLNFYFFQKKPRGRKTDAGPISSHFQRPWYSILCPFMPYASFAAKVCFMATLVTCMLNRRLMIARGTCGPRLLLVNAKYSDIVASVRTVSIVEGRLISLYSFVKKLPIIQQTSKGNSTVSTETDTYVLTSFQHERQHRGKLSY
jgi:hypothetical protein